MIKTHLNGFGRLGKSLFYNYKIDYKDMTIVEKDMDLWKCLKPFNERFKYVQKRN